MRSYRTLLCGLAWAWSLLVEPAALAQKVVFNSTTQRVEIMNERLLRQPTFQTPDELFGSNAGVLNNVLNTALSRHPQDRFAWSKKLDPNVAANSCASAASNLIKAVGDGGVLPEGWEMRQVGTLGSLTTAENTLANEADFVINWWSNGTFKDKNFDALNPPSYAHSLTVVRSPTGEYFTFDTWHNTVEVKRVYPVDPEGKYLSLDPNETDISKSSYRLSGLDENGRPWEAPPGTLPQEGPDRYTDEPPPTSEPVEVEVLTSADPNDKIGPLGAGTLRYITPDGFLNYVIRFENMADASAPAQEVLIRDTLDTAVYDLASFELGDVTFGSQRVAITGGPTRFFTRIPLEDPFEVLLDANLVPETGVVTWRFTTLDRTTNDLPFDPLDGFLPPNQTAPEGEGSVSFRLRLRDGLADATAIRNEARIIFDLNEPIDTPVWANVLDLNAPTSRVTELAAVQSDSLFTVRWAGTDEGSGLRQVDVYVAIDDGTFFRWLKGSYAGEETFVGRNDARYRFYSIAYDATGNVEPQKTTADVETAIRVDREAEAPTLPTVFHLDAAYPNPFNPTTTLHFGLPTAAPTTLVVMDVLGREVQRFYDGDLLPAGWHRVAVDGSRLASGVYLYQLRAGDFVQTRRMTLVK